MSGAQLLDCGGGRYQLHGDLSFDTATQLLVQSQAMFAGESTLELDLSGVTHADSAGLSLLIEWLRQAKRQGKSLRYLSLPLQLQALADVSEVKSLFSHTA